MKATRHSQRRTGWAIAIGGLIAAAVLVGAPPKGAAEDLPSQMVVTDALGDTQFVPPCPSPCSLTPPDVTATSMAFGSDGFLESVVTVGSFFDPATFTPNNAELKWEFFDDAGNAIGASVSLWNDRGTVRAGVNGSGVHYSDRQPCNGSATWDSGARTYTVRVPIGCSVGNVPRARWSFGYYYRSFGREMFDRVPDLTPSASMSVPSFPMRMLRNGGVTVRLFGLPGMGTQPPRAVALNVTATNATDDGFITVHPCDQLPNASNLNFVVRKDASTLVLAGTTMGPWPVNQWNTCITSSAPTHLVVDLEGTLPGLMNGYSAYPPTRILDTRDGTGGRLGKLRNESVEVPIPPNLLPPAAVSAVVLSATITQPDDAGYLTVFPCGARPNASNLNFVAGQTVANLVIVAPSGIGSICLDTPSSTHAIVDFQGVFPADAGGFHATTPVRVLDTRNGIGGFSGKVLPGAPITVQLTGTNGVPSGDVSGVALNVTAVDPDEAGYVTAYPCAGIPNASNLNFEAHTNVANAVLTSVSASGAICLATSAPVHLVADLSGWIPTPAGGGSPVFVGRTPLRIVDTRIGLG